MSFSASTCLTNTGTIPLGGLFNIYSDVDQFFNAFQTDVTYSELFGGNCPYIMGNVPDGTTSIKIIDTLTNCCVTIDINSNDLCTTCDLSFDSYQNNIIGRIVAGELTGSCENEITDYKIFWYGPDSTTNVAFTSGFGTEFAPYDLTHPLTGNNSPTALSGEYIPVIDKIKLNGLDFSQTGGTGYIQAELECFNATTVNVSPFTCDNGTEVGDYTHRVNFSGASAGETPLTLQSTFELDPTTNYFAWKFNGESVPDTLKITFYGSAYGYNPIILEFLTTGLSSPFFVNNISLLTLPKSAATFTLTSFVSKVTDLSNLTTSAGDYLKLEVIPNPNNPTTNWDFYFTCLDTFDCTLCLDSYLNTPYKIQSSSITNISGTCGLNTIEFRVSGCTSSALTNSDIYKYILTSTQAGSSYFGSVFADNLTSLITRNVQTRINYTQCGRGGSGYQNPTCSIANSNTISFIKNVSGSQGVINMTFTDLNDLIAYKTSYESKKLSSGWVNNSTDVNYYKYAELSIPNSSGNQTCGDGTLELQYYIHFSSVITTGQTSNNYTLSLPMPTIQNNLNYTSCDVGCSSSTNFIVNEINSSSTGTTNNRVLTNNTGSRYTDPVSIYWYLTQSTSNNTTGSVVGDYSFNNSFNSTLPFSGSSSPYTPIPALSSQTCDFSYKGITTNPNTQYQTQLIYVYDYQVTQGVVNNTYTISANPIVNGVRTATNYPDTVATVENGLLTYANPSYTF
jgi:hypothetical protein